MRTKMNDTEERAATSEKRERRRYEAPKVEDTAAFETLALACGKTVGTYECTLGGGYSAS
ncbi:MAG: hypothetical protein IT378_20740 [Sandaracinaceae bacterium]|nr:hypothetical protein [Sandaracinaceae bacterium]